MVKVDGSGIPGSLIQVRGLDKTYRRAGEEIHVLQGLNLDVSKGEFIAFMGPSGSGKTTLLNLAWRVGRSFARQHYRGWRRSHQHVRREPNRMACAPCGLHFSDVQPDSGAYRVSKRGAAAPADKALQSRTAQTRGNRVGRRSPRGPHESLSAATLGRTGTTRGHCARDCRGSHISAVRRAHGRPRPQERRRNSESH